MDRFWEEFETGEIHFRDKWQFELASEFSPLADQASSEYSQEFYIFIPNSLQINADTYSKKRFYHAQTNLIRFKIPEISFKELLSLQNDQSPLHKLRQCCKEIHNVDQLSAIEWELKLYANIFQATLAREVYPIIVHLEKAENEQAYTDCKYIMKVMLDEIGALIKEFNDLKLSYSNLGERFSLPLSYIFEYVEDTISIALNSCFTSLLKAVRNKHSLKLEDVDQQISHLLIKEKLYREKRLKEPSHLDKDEVHNEAILYQSSLLNKYILDALQLTTRRLAIDEKYRSLIGSFAAALAMLIYLSLFIWQGAIFVINSFPFVVFTVIIYVLKDRMKEELKNFSYRYIFRWFLDYTTEISSPSGHQVIGKMHEYFTFMPENDVPADIQHIRNEGFHSHLDMIKRPEQVIYYKKKIDIYADPLATAERLTALNIILRFDIHEFLAKASDACEPYMTLDSETFDLVSTELPKVYHINIILKNSYLKPDLTPYMELKKFRIVVDKEGIKRIESTEELPDAS